MNDLASANGVRIAVINEFDNDSVLLDAEFKKLTGGESTILVKHLYEDISKMNLQFQLEMLCNQFPKHSDSGAIDRRLLPVPHFV